MKIALLFSGQPRFSARTFDQIQKYIIQGRDIDVFCHIWNKGIQGKASDLERYNPIKIIVEEQITGYGKLPEWRGLEANNNTLNKCSMYYSAMRANELRKQYEKESGIKYDCIIKFRTDIAINDEILEIEEVDSSQNNEIFALMRKKVLEPNIAKAYKRLTQEANDIILFGKPKVMDIYCDTYNYIPTILADKKRYPLTFGGIPIFMHVVDDFGLNFRFINNTTRDGKRKFSIIRS